MTLLDIRTKAVQLSGRYDLIISTAAYVDNGMDFFINAAMRMLDRLVEIPNNTAKLYYPLAVDEYAITFQHSCRAVLSVWINDTEKRTPLEKVDLNDLKESYNDLASDATNGTPAYYALAELRALETTAQDSLGVFINKTFDESDTKYDYRGIILVPPADGDYVVEISGLFKSEVLSNDADENYWTVQEEDLLLRAVLYKIEAFSRGTENAKNWLSAILDDVRLISFDIAEEESNGINQLEG